MKKLVEQIVKFAIVGGSAFVVEYIMLFIFKEWILAALLTDAGPATLGLIAAPIAFTISTVYNYILSVKWVFVKRTDTNGGQTFGIFVLLSVIALGLNQLFMTVFIKHLGINTYIAKLPSTFLVMVYNFISRKIFIEDHSGKKAD